MPNMARLPGVWRPIPVSFWLGCPWSLQTIWELARLNCMFSVTVATGRTFITPSDDSLKATAALLEADKAAGTWPIPYKALRGDSGKAAYPGTMLMSMNVPTGGLPAADASRFAQLITFAVTSGQTRGLDNGQLPLGYLPMTTGNGMGSLVAYSKTAAAAVRAQQGYVPAVDGSSKPPTPTPTPTPAAPTPLPSTGQPTDTGTGATPAASVTPTAAPAVSATPTATPVKLVATGVTVAVGTGALGKALPALLGLALLTGLGAVVTAFWGRT